jgi:outer membrane receptor protein involved in Fe transport
VNLSKDSIEYRDPNYFANDIVFISSFTTKTGNLGLNLKRDFGTHFHLDAGIEQLMSTLNSRQSLHSTPQRLQNFSFLKGSFSKNNWKLIAQLGSQYVQEENTSGSSARNVFRLTPYIQAEKTLGKKYTLSAFYRNSFRMPSFNELYYNNIGNTQLKPEDAHQFSLSNSFLLLERKKTMISLQISGYYQLVNNMILAIPTKNLFVWSIQNIGKNKIIGSEAVLNINHQWSKSWSSELSSNYTFQNSVDLSDRKSPSYGNQIAYVPVHSGNVDLSILFKKHGIRISNFVSSKRYSLNENILANEVPAFSILDVSIFGAITWQDHSKIRLQFTVKNILNSSYAYVRSFIMPGRNYLITLSYEI